ncbi:MAG: vWA domain-containing protein [Burkholderiaceae bacterium]
MSLRSRLRVVLEPQGRLIFLAFALLLFAATGPTLSVSSATSDFIIVFDITQSMDVEDYARDGVPVSRLNYAKQAARQALRNLPCGSQIGWGAFTEYQTLLLLAPIEVCSNYSELVAELDRIDYHMRWANRSEIAKGVFWAVRAAKEVGHDPRLIFLTDGQEAPPLAVGEMALWDDLKAGEIKGWLIGTGDSFAAPIPHSDQDGHSLGYWRADEVVQFASDATDRRVETGHEHLSGLHENYLQTLARNLGLDYRRLDTEDSISEALKDPRFAHHHPTTSDIAWIPAALALFLLCAQFVPLPSWRLR